MVPWFFSARGYLQATIKECRKALASHNTGLTVLTHGRLHTEQGHLCAKHLGKGAKPCPKTELPVTILRQPASRNIVAIIAMFALMALVPAQTQLTNGQPVVADLALAEVKTYKIVLDINV